MKIKKSIALLGTLAIMILFTGCDESSDNSNNGSVDVAGAWKYKISWRNETATTRVESTDNGKIVNNRSGTSGTIQLKLYFTSYKYEGGSINGYVMAKDTFDPLESGHSWVNVSFADNVGLPPVGVYYVTLVLLEYDGEYYVKDYINFDDVMIIYNIPYYEYSYYYYYYYY